MRTPLTALLLALGLVVVGCGGGQKKTTDPSTSSDSSKDDGSKEKWEGATPDDQKGSSGSSGSSGSGGSDTASGGNSGSGAAPVNSPPQRRSDQYDKEHTDIVLNRAVRQVKTNCGLATDDTGKAPGPWGKVTISVMLGHNGHSKGATVPAPYADTPGGRCIAHAFSILTFPPWGGADTPVDVEVELVKPDAAKSGK